MPSDSRLSGELVYSRAAVEAGWHGRNTSHCLTIASLPTAPCHVTAASAQHWRLVRDLQFQL